MFEIFPSENEPQNITFKQKCETKIAFLLKKEAADKNSKRIPTIDSWEIINIFVMLLEFHLKFWAKPQPFITFYAL